MNVDFGRTAGDYGRYRAGFPEAFFERLSTFGVGERGQKVLDLGTGTGTVARGLALRGCEVVGLDPAAALLEEAKRLDREAGVEVEYRVATAEDTGLPDSAFDAVTAGQCWHWFDRGRAAREALRVLKPGGRLVISHFDWIPLPGNVVEETEKLIERHNPDWRLGGGTGLYPAWLADVASTGFVGVETFSFDVSVAYTHEGWRGRIRASAGVSASLEPEQVRDFDAELARLLQEGFPRDPLEVPHRIFAVVCALPGGGDGLPAEHPNVGTVRGLYEARERRDLDAVRALLAEDVRWVEPRLDNEHTGELRGADAVLAMISEARRRTGGTFRLQLREALAYGNQVVALVDWSATRGGKILVGKEVAVFRVRREKIEEVSFHPDDLGNDERFWS